MNDTLPHLSPEELPPTNPEAARPVDVAEIVHTAREAAGLSRERLANALDGAGHRWHASTVHALETRGRRLRADEVIPLADALRIDPYALLSAAPGRTAWDDGWQAGRTAVLAVLTGPILDLDNALHNAHMLDPKETP